MKLEEKLVVLRKQKGLSQLELAEMMRVSRQAVSRWEVGAAVPSTDNLKYLGRLYNVPLEYLLHDDASEPAHLELKPDTEETAHDTRKKNKRILLALIVFGVAVAALCVMLFSNKENAPIPMEDIKGSDAVIVDDFEMDW